MIKYVHGNIFNSTDECLINPVNCVGIMGKGLALQFKRRFPNNFRAYTALCQKGTIRPGHIMLHQTRLTQPRYIVNFPTKDHWRNPSQLTYIEQGLENLVPLIRRHDITTLSIPPVGCGLGGLPWSTVQPLLEQHLAKLNNVQITIYRPHSN